MSMEDVSQDFTKYESGSWCMNDDAVFKYYNILRQLELLDIEPKSIMEPGCQTCPLSSLISGRYSIKRAHLFDYQRVSGKNIGEIQKGLFKKNTKTELFFHGGDFFENVEKIDDNSVDLIIDGCSVTHFCGSDEITYSGKKSWSKMKSVCDRKLSENGHFIISSDVKYSEDIELTGSSGEFVYPKDIINIFSPDYSLVSKPILSSKTWNPMNLYPLKVMILCLKKSSLVTRKSI